MNIPSVLLWTGKTRSYLLATHNLVIVVESGVNAHDTVWNSRICNKSGSYELLKYLIENDLVVENNL